MSLIDDMLAKGKALLQQVAKPRPSQPGVHEAIGRDRFDEWGWTGLKEDVPNLEKNIEEIALHHDYVGSFFEDFYNLLHKGDPKLRDKADVDERYHPNVDMAESFQDMPEIKSLRLSTMHDQYATALAMLSMQSTLKNAYAQAADAREKAKAAAEEREQLRQMLQDLADMMAELGQMDPNSEEAGDLALGMATLAADIEDQSGITAQVEASADQASQDAANRAEMQMRAAARRADNEVREEQELAQNFGIEDGVLQRMSFEERKELSEKLRNNRLAAFAKIIGQFRNIESGEVRRRVIHAPDEIVGVELGDDLIRLTASEQLNLAEPILEDDFWRRWADKELITYKMRGREKVGRGPIIVVCDESGSMGGGAYGGVDLPLSTPEAFSKALALALCERARKDKRDFHYIGFSSASQQWHLEFPGGEAPIDKVIEFTEHFFCGGTHYETPLQMAADIVKQYEADGKPKPDIVFITDDAYTSIQEDFLTEWNETREKTQMRCFGILIGQEGQTSGALEQVADNIRTISDLSGDADDTRDIFRMV